MTTLGLFVKLPIPGRVKTRLATEFGAERAAEVYSTFIAAAINRFRATADRRLLCFAPATDEARGHFSARMGPDYDLWPQPDGDLGARLSAFFADHLQRPDDRVVIIGSDSPTLPREHVELAFELLREVDCVLGPATDGGYYLIGQRGKNQPIFTGVDWSTSRVLEQTVSLISQCGARLAVLPPWYDVDTPDDWQFLMGHLRALEAADGILDDPLLRELQRGLRARRT